MAYLILSGLWSCTAIDCSHKPVNIPTELVSIENEEIPVEVITSTDTAPAFHPISDTCCS